VHAADDLSVWQTLEALPDIFATAAEIVAGKPLHLGLLSIGMRSNPYGAAVAPNPDRLRLPMAMDDPRQGTGFAAAYAVAVLARAAAAGVGSLALAMPDGPLGAQGPLGDVVRAAAALSGREVRISEAGGVVAIDAGGAVLAANCTAAPAPSPVPGLPPLDAGTAAVRLP
jgi:D-apionolactonase